MLYTFLKDSVRFFREHLIPLIIITLGIGVVFEVLAALFHGAFPDVPYGWPMLLIQWLGGLWASASVVLYVGGSVNNQYLPPKHAISRGMLWVLPLAAVQLVTGLAVGLGLLLIVPGIYLGVKLALATFYLIDARQSIPDAIRNAWIGSQGFGWVIFGGYTLIYGTLFLVTQGLISTLGLADGYGPINFFVALIFKPVGAFALIFGYRVYSQTSPTPVTA